MDLLVAAWDSAVDAAKEYAGDLVEATSHYIFGKPQVNINPSTTFSRSNSFSNCTLAEEVKFKFKQCCYVNYDLKAINSNCYEGQEYKFDMSICYYRGGLLGAKDESLEVYRPFTADEGYRLLQNSLGKCSSQSSETHESSSRSFEGADLENYAVEVKLSSKDGSLLPKTLADDFYNTAKGIYKPIIEQVMGEDYLMFKAKVWLITASALVGGAIAAMFAGGFCCYFLYISPNNVIPGKDSNEKPLRPWAWNEVRDMDKYRRN